MSPRHKTCVLVLAGTLMLCLAWLALTRMGEQPSDTRVDAARRETPAAPADRADDRIEAAAARERQHMVAQIRAWDFADERVLEAMDRVPRHRFVPEASRDLAYADRALPIGHGQTISQPSLVALMTQLVQPQPTARALDIGTGSGYQAAVLAELVAEVYSIEIVCPLADEARQRLKSLGYQNVEVRCGDGYRGWPEHAPFDVIVVAAAPDHIPQPLIEQLAPGGRLVLPVGEFFDQELLLVEKRPDGTLRTETIALVAFVPMTGEAEEGPSREP